MLAFVVCLPAAERNIARKAHGRQKQTIMMERRELSFIGAKWQLGDVGGRTVSGEFPTRNRWSAIVWWPRAERTQVCIPLASPVHVE